MDFRGFIEVVVRDGMEAARADYVKPEDKQRLEGSLKGFEECRGKSYEELEKLLLDSRRELQDRFGEADYWYWRCRADEIEWVCNVVSAAVQGRSGWIVTPTARGALKAAEVLAKGRGYLVVE